MKKVTILFEFDEGKLGKEWFNIFNLELMLYSKGYTKRKLLKCTLIQNEKKPKQLKTTL